MTDTTYEYIFLPLAPWEGKDVCVNVMYVLVYRYKKYFSHNKAIVENIWCVRKENKMFYRNVSFFSSN